MSRSTGAARFGALVPTGLYGQRAAQAMLASVRGSGGRLTGLETFNRSPAAARSAAALLNGKGRIRCGADRRQRPDGGARGDRGQARTAPARHRIMGQRPDARRRLRGCAARWYAAAPDARFDQLVTRYRARYGKTPYRLGSLGYDAVLLTVRARGTGPRAGRSRREAWSIARASPGSTAFSASAATALRSARSKCGR